MDRSSRFLHRWEDPAAGMLLLGVVSILGPGGLPPVLGAPPPASYLSTVETTEEKEVFSPPHTHFGTYEPRT